MVHKALLVVAIDPDTVKSGISQLSINERKVKVFNYTFAELCEYLNLIRSVVDENGIAADIVVEKSWGNTHNTHLTSNQSRAAASKTGYNIGRCHQVGMCICDYARSIGLNVIEHNPLKKRWSGRDGKITHDEMNTILSNANIERLKKSNQETRDSLLLGLVYSNIQIRI